MEKLKIEKVDTILEFNSNSGFGITPNVSSHIFWKKRNTGYCKVFFYQWKEDELVAMESREMETNWDELIQKTTALKLDTVTSEPERFTAYSSDMAFLSYKLRLPVWKSEFANYNISNKDLSHPKNEFFRSIRKFTGI